MEAMECTHGQLELMTKARARRRASDVCVLSSIVSLAVANGMGAKGAGKELRQMCEKLVEQAGITL